MRSSQSEAFMTTKTWFRSAALIVCRILIGGVLDRMWQHGVIPAASAQEGRAGAAAAPPRPMTPAEMQAEIERLKTLVPSYSHPMQDVAINWQASGSPRKGRTGLSRVISTTKRDRTLHGPCASTRTTKSMTRSSISSQSTTRFAGCCCGAGGCGFGSGLRGKSVSRFAVL